MWRQFVAQIARLGRSHILHLLMQQHHLLLQQVELLLLSKDAAIERLDQVFREAQLGFKFMDAGFWRLNLHMRLQRHSF